MSGSGRLEGKVAIVTGGGQGIGEAIAVGYAREGARVLVTGRTLGKLEDVVAKITEAGGTAMALDAVAGEAEQSKATVDKVMAEWGRVDTLVNNAHSFTDYLPLADPKMEENCKIDFQSAFFGSLQLMQLCYPHMVAQGGGSIINMGSSYGIRCEPGFLAYAASKEAIRALTRTAAREWGKDKIRVNTILPSALSPKALWYLEESKTYDLELSKVAMGRFGAPEDIAPTAIFLASDESDFVTGQTIGVEGGAVMF
ncbi:SDR family NAD(P)-dependent oxidoreductase [Novosphingobium album (ex Hu et al. 2023)]|uniref:SDR family oxidoreductase n=1 Tax=Novosphingobium album (ex Hu et al. 2023) TaxID=2930093 RepID=A0ABT0B7G4_9SPHN|nr:SDR family oxidoreductase [Novosphingobium album (ex Hu et al. 2023)]MCJ2180849.1 SDR family oxidoreductase [Novosphingobium album (ex Hu et al. 2023)]